MAVLVLDKLVEERIRAERVETERDEVWDGLLVLLPLLDVEHQEIVSELTFQFIGVLGSRRAGTVYAGVNVSDRAGGWLENYRIPDVAVYLAGNPAEDSGTHYQGGPDLAVEVVSAGDRSRDKAAFYAAVGVREFLVIDREPWTVELYRRGDAGMALAGRAGVGDGPIRLDTLPLTVGLHAGSPRPVLVIEHAGDGRRWTI